jgi:hypothetical protein
VQAQGIAETVAGPISATTTGSEAEQAIREEYNNYNNKVKVRMRMMVWMEVE